MGDPGTDKDVETDQALVEAARAGDRQAMVAIYDRWADRLYNHCFYLRLRHEDQARDLTQQTFVTAIRALDQLHEPARLGGWLFAIAHFEASRMAPARAAWDPAAEADTDAEAEAESVAVPLTGTAVDAELRREVWRLDWRGGAWRAGVRAARGAAPWVGRRFHHGGAPAGVAAHRPLRGLYGASPHAGHARGAAAAAGTVAVASTGPDSQPAPARGCRWQAPGPPGPCTSAPARRRAAAAVAPLGAEPR